MKKRIYMYLFFFTLLLVLFQYVNQKGIFEKQEEQIHSLREKTERLNDSIQVLRMQNADLDYFKFLGNDNAMDYFENDGWNAEEVEALVRSEIYGNNSSKGDNPLVPYAGMEGVTKINKVTFLNHKWVVADFTDGSYWGEMLLQYDLNADKTIEFQVLSSVIYPR